MSAGTNLIARITRCRLGLPLVVLPDRPFNGLELHPHDLERLGNQMIAVAKIARRHRGTQGTTVVMP